MPLSLFFFGECPSTLILLIFFPPSCTDSKVLCCAQLVIDSLVQLQLLKFVLTHIVRVQLVKFPTNWTHLWNTLLLNSIIYFIPLFQSLLWSSTTTNLPSQILAWFCVCFSVDVTPLAQPVAYKSIHCIACGLLILSWIEDWQTFFYKRPNSQYLMLCRPCIVSGTHPSMSLLFVSFCCCCCCFYNPFKNMKSILSSKVNNKAGIVSALICRS